MNVVKNKTMRLIQAIIPEGKKETIVDLLTEKGIDYVISPETSQRRYSDILFFPLPKQGVEEVLDDLRDAGLEKNGFTVVTKAEAIVAREFEELQEKYREESEVDESKVARQELKTGVEGLSPSQPTFYLLMFAASLIATAGILMDNTAVVVGSMVIAPMIGPAMTSCVGTVIDDGEMFYDGVKKQLLGVLLAISSSIVFTKIAMVVLLHPNLELLSLNQITHQLNPGFLSLVVALGSGLAGAFSLTAGINSALVGVMISVALLPPAAAAGIGISTLDLKIMTGAGVILMINLISINLAGTFTLWIQGYKPGRWYEQRGAEKATKHRITVLVVLLLIIAVFLGFVTWNMRTEGLKTSHLEEIAAESVSGRGMILTGFVTEENGLFLEEITAVNVSVRGSEYPDGLKKELSEEMGAYLERDLEVIITFKVAG